MTTVKLEGTQLIEAHPGEEVTVEVPGANTTGYLWRLKTDSNSVQIVGHEVVPDNKSFGGAGVERFVVKSLKAGQATLHFELKAPWESDPAESYDVQVRSIAE